MKRYAQHLASLFIFGRSYFVKALKELTKELIFNELAERSIVLLSIAVSKKLIEVNHDYPLLKVYVVI